MPAVLFPGTFLPVQISEHAQRDLVRECADSNRPLAKAQEIHAAVPREVTTQ
jgi:Lon protease-like protein